MSGQVTDLSLVPGPAELTCEVLVIGSGCAGATAAWDLAAAGKDVLVLEEGGDRTGLQLTQRDGQMYDQLYMDRGGRATDDLSVSVLQGRALGGGGVINACDVVPIHDGTLRCWVKRHGLSGFTPEALAPFRDRALKDLSARVPGEAHLNRNNQLLRAGTQALGWRGEVMMHNRVGCGGIGTCLIGCPMDAKQNPRFVAVPGALAAGARILLRARAVRLEDAGAEVKTVRVRRLDPQGYHETTELTVRAKTVILAANAVASAQLLLRSGLGNEHVGRHLSLQAQLPIAALFDETVRSFRGIPQAWAVTQFEEHDHPEHGFWGFRVEAISGTPGIVGSLLAEGGPLGKATMRSYPNLAAALLLAPDELQGRVEVEPSGRLRIRYALTDEQRGRLRAAVRAAARIWFAAGAREVVVPTVPMLRLSGERDLGKVDGLSLAPATAPLLSAHQQGTVRFAGSPRDGGADPDGQVWGTRGVFVFDSSGFPTSASSHTMAPILTVSHYLSQRLLARA